LCYQISIFVKENFVEFVSEENLDLIIFLSFWLRPNTHIPFLTRGIHDSEEKLLSGEYAVANEADFCVPQLQHDRENY